MNSFFLFFVGGTQDTEIDATVKHIDHIRKIPGLRQATMILYIEGNFGGWPMTQRLFSSVKQLSSARVLAVRELRREGSRDEKDVGLYTRRNDKYLAVELFNALLASKKIRFHPLFCSVFKCPDGTSRKDYLYKQLLQLEYRVSDAKEWGQKQYKISGKARGPDDCGMGLILGVLHAVFLMSDADYIQLAFPLFVPFNRSHITEIYKDEYAKRDISLIN